MKDYGHAEVVVNLLREVTYLRKEVARLKDVEIAYTELLRSTNTHAAIMSKNYIELVLTKGELTPHAELRSLG